MSTGIAELLEIGVSARLLANFNEVRLPEEQRPTEVAISAGAAEVDGIDHHAALQSAVDRVLHIGILADQRSPNNDRRHR